jgi:trigger factor
VRPKGSRGDHGLCARVAELVDALVLGTSILGCESSSLSFRTTSSVPGFEAGTVKVNITMQVTLETTSGLERRMRISVPGAELETKVEAKLKETAKQAKIKGFRPGKVPLREVKRRFGDGIRQEVGSEIMQSSFAEAVQQESVSPAGMPHIEDVKIEAGQDLEFTAVFEVFPVIELAGFDGIEIERPVAKVTPADVDKMIETLQTQRTEFGEVDRECQADDQVNIDFEGSIDGELFEGGKSEGSDIVIGSGSMIPGFEEGIKGMKAGDDKNITVSFPEDYQAENLAGKEAIFAIKVNKVSESIKPELDDEFFKQFGVKEGGMDAFRNEVSANMEKELGTAVKSKVKNQALDGLRKVNKIALPKALIDQEIDRLKQDAIQQFGGQMKIDTSMLPSEMFTSQAEKRVALGLLVNSIVEQNEIKVDNDRVKTMIHDMASSYEDPEQVINFYYNNQQQLGQIQNVVLEDQVIDLIVAGANVTDVEQPYEEAIKPAAPAPAEEESEEFSAD